MVPTARLIVDGPQGAERSIILAEAEIHPMRQGHGFLYASNAVKARLKVEQTR